MPDFVNRTDDHVIGVVYTRHSSSVALWFLLQCIQQALVGLWYFHLFLSVKKFQYILDACAMILLCCMWLATDSSDEALLKSSPGQLAVLGGKKVLLEYCFFV